MALALLVRGVDQQRPIVETASTGPTPIVRLFHKPSNRTLERSLCALLCDSSRHQRVLPSRWTPFACSACSQVTDVGRPRRRGEKVCSPGEISVTVYEVRATISTPGA
jgi:hypothetical protein